MNSPSITDSLAFKQLWRDELSSYIDRFQNQELSTREMLVEITKGMDRFLVDLIQYVLSQLPQQHQAEIEQQIAIIAVGGYGRGEMFPYSDVDLLITFDKATSPEANQFCSEFVRTTWDAGLKLGHAIRSTSDTVSLARDESQVATGLVQTRLIWGEQSLHQKLRTSFTNWVRKSTRKFIDNCEESRRDEIKETAMAVFSLEPDVKRSPGTLRDLQIMRWVAFARHETTSLAKLAEKKVLKRSVVRQLEIAQEYFNNLRMDLQTDARRAQDILSRAEQLRLTDQTGITDLAGLRAVERFMQNYFQLASFVDRTSKRFVELSKPSSFQERVASKFKRRLIDEKYVLFADRLNVVAIHASTVTSSLPEILKTILVAAEMKTRVSSRFIETVRNKRDELDTNVSEESADLFMKILAQHGRVEKAVRDLSECGVLELLIPHFSHAWGLLQFNHYHAYTVGEHTFQTLRHLDSFQNDPYLKAVHRDLEKPALLALTLILHDLGKGFEEDHSILGEKIARSAGYRLYLDDSSVSQIARLVLEHLNMSMLAFRRDTSDPDVVAAFAEKVRDLDTLRKLYLLTIADIKGVAPGIWDDWKSQLLQELYERTSEFFAGQYGRPNVVEKLKEVRQKTIALYSEECDSDEEIKVLSEELEQMPDHYLLSADPESMIEDMQVAMGMSDSNVEIMDRYDEQTNTLELTIILRHETSERFFHRITGVLTAARFEILSAEISTSKTGLACDRFLLKDKDSIQGTSPDKLARIKKQLCEAVAHPIALESLFQKQRRYQTGKRTEPISNQQRSVKIDNETSNQATIVDIFAHDRPGLLFTLATTIHDLDLSVNLARITTHVDQIVDVFYLTDLNGQKIDSPETSERIRTQIEQTLDEFEQSGYKMFV